MLPLVIGRELRGLSAEVTADGAGAVRVNKIAGEIGAGTFTGSVYFQFRDELLQHAEAEMHVPAGRAVPFTLQGVSYGTLSGDVFADANLDHDLFKINLQAPTLRGEMPPPRSGSLEPLDDNPLVVVLQPLAPLPERAAMGGGPENRDPARSPWS